MKRFARLGYRARASLLVLALLPLMGSDCDSDDFGSSEIIDIIYAVGDVVLAILSFV